MKKQKKSATLNLSTTMNTPSVNSPICVYHQPNCPFSINNDNAPYYYYPPPPAQYVYSPESFYTQTMFSDPFVAYGQ